MGMLKDMASMKKMMNMTKPEKGETKKHEKTETKKVEKTEDKVKKSGTFDGKSNKLGMGGRASQLKSKGVPGGVIGMLARKEQAAPGQKNYKGGKK